MAQDLTISWVVKKKGEDHLINVNSNNHINEFNIDELNLAIKNFKRNQSFRHRNYYN